MPWLLSAVAEVRDRAMPRTRPSYSCWLSNLISVTLKCASVTAVNAFSIGHELVTSHVNANEEYDQRTKRNKWNDAIKAGIAMIRARQEAEAAAKAAIARVASQSAYY